MAHVTTTQCCGVREITGLAGHAGRGGKDALRSILRSSLYLGMGTPHAPAFAFYTFTQAHVNDSPPRRQAYGDQLAAAIEKYGLGSVVVTTPRLNRGSGNNVKVYVWAVDWPAVIRFYSAL